MKQLSKIPYQKTVKIAAINDQGLADLLFPMGCIVGEYIEKVRSAPFGDPLMCRVGDHFISIRKKDAEQIIVTELS